MKVEFTGKSFRIRLSALVLTSLLLSGCASLFGRNGSGGFRSSDPDFVGVANSTSAPAAVPVEIALDISALSQGRPLTPQIQEATVESSVPTLAQPQAVTQESPPSPTPALEGFDSSLASVKKKVSSRKPASKGGKGTENYRVKNGDTLMKISFQKFGSLFRWREIYEENKHRIADFNKLVPGTILTIRGVEYVVITKNGEPYLIRRGDTLVKISKKVYGTPARWKKIWKNNPELITDPNKIYAGFTLYYEPMGTDEHRLSSQPAPSSLPRKPSSTAKD